MNRLGNPKIIAALAIMVLAVLWRVPPIHAFNPQPDPPAFGMVGIAAYETIRLNAVCADGPLPGGVQPGPCDVTLVFRNVRGGIVKQATVSPLPGAGTFLDLSASEVALSGRRAEFTPCIKPVGTGFVLGTVEVFDGLHRTHNGGAQSHRAQISRNFDHYRSVRTGYDNQGQASRPAPDGFADFMLPIGGQGICQ